MLSLRRISFLAKLSHAAQYAAFGFAAQRLPSRLFNQAKLGHVPPVYRSLIIKNMHSFSAQKKLSQADADYIKKLQEQVELCFSVQDYDQARKILMLVTEFLLKKGYTGFEYAQALWKIGESYKFEEKRTDALDHFVRAEKVFDSLEGNFEEEKALIQLLYGEDFYYRQDYDQAERCLLKCAQILQKTTHKHEMQVMVVGFLGSINQHKQKYEDAIRFFATQLQIIRQSFELKGLYANVAIKALVLIGKCYVQTGKFEQALASRLQAKRLYESEGLQKTKEYVDNLTNLAYIHQSLNQQQQFLDCTEKAHGIKVQMAKRDNPGFLNLLSELRLEQFQTEKSDQSLPQVQQYLSIQNSLPKEKKDSQYANALLFIAMIYRNKDNYTESLKHLKQSLEIQEKDGPLDNVALILKQMTEIYLHLKDFASSLDCAFRCLAAYKKLYGEKSSKNAEIYSIIAIIYQSMGNQAENLKFVEMAQSVLGDQTKAENK